MNIHTLLEHKITFISSIVAFVLVSFLAIYYLVIPQQHILTSVPAQMTNISLSVSAEGKVDTDQHVSLAFQRPGRVSAVNVAVGDSVHQGQLLGSLDHDQLSASLQAAQADALSAQANLSAIRSGATPQTLAVYNQNISTTQLSLSSAVTDSYLKIQDALLNKMNTFFDNNTSVNPTLKTILGPYETMRRTEIQMARLDMTTRMAKWNSLIQSNPSSDDVLLEAKNDIASAKLFIGSISNLANNLSVNTNGISQSSIDSYVSIANSAAVEVNAAETELNTANQAYKTSTATSSPESLQVAEAALAKAQANVAAIQSQINDSTLIAPFSGIVSSVNIELGDNFNVNSPAVDIISPGAYKIDIFVPENQIAAVVAGNPVNISFNDYGSSLIATGTVTSVDLSQTVVSGVGAYKATVHFSNSDQRIRTGMNVVVTIAGPSKDHVIAIPSSAIVKKLDGSYVLVKNSSSQYIERKITTGISGSGLTEVISGIEVGEVVATFGDSSY